MSRLLTKVLPIRGEDFQVSEIAAGPMKHIRKVMSDPSPDKSELDLYVVSKCCISPKLSPSEWEEMPAAIVTELARMAWTLTNGDKPGAAKAEEKKD